MTAFGAKRDALVDGREKARGPVDGSASRQLARIGQNDESGQVVVFGSQAEAEPGAHAGEPIALKAGVHLEGSGSVVGALRDHRVDKGNIVDPLGEVGQEVADPFAGLSVLTEGPGTFHEIAGLAEKRIHLTLAGHRFAVAADEFGLVVEGVDVADAACAEDLDDALHLRREVRGLRRIG